MNKNLTEKQIEILVRDFQLNSQNLEVDGIAGPKTITEINNVGIESIFIPQEESFKPRWPMFGKAVISDPFGTQKRGGRGHFGIDIAYRRHISGVADLPQLTRHYICSGLEHILACENGEVLSIIRSKRNGWVIKIDHGRYISVYRHLSSVQSVSGVIEKGTKIGIIGFAPSAGNSGFFHLHFEIWDMSLPGPKNSRRHHAIDPEPFLT